MSHMTERLQGFALLLAAVLPAGASAQAIQSATLRRAQQAYDNPDYPQAPSLTQAAPKERLTPTHRVQAHQLLGFTHNVLHSPPRPVAAVNQAGFIDPPPSPHPHQQP